MASLSFRQKAIEDLSGIWNYTFYTWSEQQADKYYLSIKKACVELSEYRDYGRNYPEIHQNLFGATCGRHIIFFHHISENEIEIIRILHEQMDLKKAIDE